MFHTPPHKQTDPDKYPGQVTNLLDTTTTDASKLDVWLALLVLACAILGALYGIVSG